MKRLQLSVTANSEILGDTPQSVTVDGSSSFVIGRDPQANWALPDPTRQMSSKHCIISYDGANYRLRDTSTNGTFLNGAAKRLMSEHNLSDGDIVDVGPYSIKATYLDDNPRATESKSSMTASANIWDNDDVPQTRSATPRGADPAAMVIAQDSTRSAPASDHRTEPVGPSTLTVIRPAPKPRAAQQTTAETPRTQATEVPELAAVHTEPNRQAEKQLDQTSDAAPQPGLGTGSSTPFVTGLTKGLGLPSDLLVHETPEQLGERIGLLIRAFAEGFCELLAERSKVRRALGSRKPVNPRKLAANPLRSSATIDDALERILNSECGNTEIVQMMRDIISELISHQDAVIAAIDRAALRVGQDIDPSTLAAAFAGNASSKDGKSKLWDLYSVIWHDLGTDWPAAFVENLRMQLAAAYDEIS